MATFFDWTALYSGVGMSVFLVSQIVEIALRLKGSALINSLHTGVATGTMKSLFDNGS